METARQVQARLRSLPDQQLLRSLAGSGVSSRDLALVCLEAESRGGIDFLRARIASLPLYPLIAVGFWREEPGDPLPRPSDLVRGGGLQEQIPAIVNYLRSGRTSASYLGDAECRFLDCAAGSNLGSRELTDGEWAWPEGLPHYIECHQVMLPEEFINKMRYCQWRCPQFEVATALQPKYRGFRLDFTKWVDWGRQFGTTSS